MEGFGGQEICLRGSNSKVNKYRATCKDATRPKVLKYVQELD